MGLRPERPGSQPAKAKDRLPLNRRANQVVCRLPAISGSASRRHAFCSHVKAAVAAAKLLVAVEHVEIGL
jgi:hypothetical protein